MDKCNGWSNYMTWRAAAFLQNDEAAYQFVTEDLTYCESRQHAISTCYNSLELLFEYELDQLEGGSLGAEMMRAAITEIDYHELAVSFVDEFCDWDWEEGES